MQLLFCAVYKEYDVESGRYQHATNRVFEFSKTQIRPIPSKKKRRVLETQRQKENNKTVSIVFTSKHVMKIKRIVTIAVTKC